MSKVNSTTARITLVAAVIAAVVSSFNVLLTSWSSSRLEHQKWVQARDDEMKREFRNALGDLTRALATGGHKIRWVTWKAQHDPKGFSKEDIAAYNRDMTLVLPDLASAYLLIAGMDRATYDQLAPFVERFYSLDAKIAETAAEFTQEPNRVIPALAAIHAEASKYLGELKRKIAGAFELTAYGKQPNNRLEPDR